MRSKEIQKATCSLGMLRVLYTMVRLWARLRIFTLITCIWHICSGRSTPPLSFFFATGCCICCPFPPPC
jgi:hypothetical protein